ncbi:uncharacterized protein LOC142584152 [Dermacentor variabilis]|uniref:uncharacterized protein LOC142584152 n=1 Tax=Dermacentor variabilis TaxID=34621 RepID=UPI003F5C3D4F
MCKQDVAISFRVGTSTVATIVHNVCRLLRRTLQPLYLKVATSEAWQKVAQGFEEKWNFSQCSCAVDDKHIQIQAPANSGNLYYNYKIFNEVGHIFITCAYSLILLQGTYSVVLMAAVDSNLEFICVDIGAYGRQSDGGTLSASRFAKSLEEGLLGLQPPKHLPGTNIVAPHVFVVDEAFQLRLDFLRPYSGRCQNENKCIFN